jgi:hypothetical protein
MISQPSTSFFGIASSMCKLVICGIEEEITAIIELLPDVLKKVCTEIEQFLEGCYVTVLSTLNHIGNYK